MPDIACIIVGVFIALYFAIRLTLRHYFPPDTCPLAADTCMHGKRNGPA